MHEVQLGVRGRVDADGGDGAVSRVPNHRSVWPRATQERGKPRPLVDSRRKGTGKPMDYNTVAVLDRDRWIRRLRRRSKVLAVGSWGEFEPTRDRAGTQGPTGSTEYPTRGGDGEQARVYHD